MSEKKVFVIDADEEEKKGSDGKNFMLIKIPPGYTHTEVRYKDHPKYSSTGKLSESDEFSGCHMMLLKPSRVEYMEENRSNFIWIDGHPFPASQENT